MSLSIESPTNLVKKLVEVYFEEEVWHDKKLSKEEATRYHNHIVERGRIVTASHDNELLGYIESWRVNFEQLGRILCMAPFTPLEEDIETGNICYGANIWIKQAYRGGETDRLLRNLFFQQNYVCDYFVWQSSRKKVNTLKVFKRQEFFHKYFKEEGTVITNGKE